MCKNMTLWKARRGETLKWRIECGVFCHDGGLGLGYCVEEDENWTRDGQRA